MSRTTVRSIRTQIAATTKKVEYLTLWRDRLTHGRRLLLLAGDSPAAAAALLAIDRGLGPDQGPPPALLALDRGACTEWNGASLPSIERDLANETERLELLREGLPSPAEIAAAQAHAETLLKRVKAAGVRSLAEYTGLSNAIAAAELAADRFAAARAQAEPLAAELAELCEQFGLDVETPTIDPSREAREIPARVAAHVGHVARYLTIDRELVAEIDRRRPAAA